MYIFYVSFTGQKTLGPRPDRSPLGIQFKISDEHPTPFICGVPPPPPGRLIGSLSNDDDDDGGNGKRHYKLYHIYLDPLNSLNVGDLDHVYCR